MQIGIVAAKIVPRGLSIIAMSAAACDSSMRSRRQKWTIASFRIMKVKRHWLLAAKLLTPLLSSNGNEKEVVAYLWFGQLHRKDQVHKKTTIF
jgi:hypothetical protein